MLGKNFLTFHVSFFINTEYAVFYKYRICSFINTEYAVIKSMNCKVHFKSPKTLKGKKKKFHIIINSCCSILLKVFCQIYS